MRGESSGKSGEAGGPPEDLTTYHVRQARGGDEKSLRWLVTRFTPLLRAAAAYRLGPHLRALYEPEDIVQDAWAVALPRLGDLVPRSDRYTPVLLKFLSTAIIRRVQHLTRKHIREAQRPVRLAAAQSGGKDPESEDPLKALPARQTTILRRLLRRERRDLVAAALERLEERDRGIIILRGVEGQPYSEIGLLLKEEPKSLAVRYQRALDKLRRELPRSVFEEFRVD
jgi:RNA polymerase sigma factor (sigma-70 family)